MKDNLLFLLKSFLKVLDIRIDTEELRIQFLSHPSYPSLHSLTGVLTHFNISNAAVRLPLKEDTLDQLTNTFIAQVNSINGQQLVLVKKHGKNYEIIYSKKKKDYLSQKEFLHVFSGVVVVVEKDSDEYNVAIKRRLWIYPVISIAVMSFLLLFIFNGPGLEAILLILSSLFGLIISATIFNQENGKETFIGNAFCKSTDDNDNCSSVLNSKGAKLLNTIKLSDACIIFFSTLLFSLFLLQVSGSPFGFVYIMNFLVLPMTLYSIYYQKFILKNWCRLCLIIVATLWSQAAIVLAYNVNLDFEIDIKSSLIILGTSLFTFLTWDFIRKMIETKIELQELKIEHMRFKKNFSLFKSSLFDNDLVETRIESTTKMEYGNPGSNLKLVVLTNPFCGHCKPVHKLIENILSKYRKSVGISIRFNVSTENEKSDALRVARRIIEIYHNNRKDESLNAMHDIYDGMETEKWIKKWGECKNPKMMDQTLEANRNWCISKTLNFTPVLLINGRQFPMEYKRDDLFYFIEDLKEHMDENLKIQNVV